MLVDKLEWSDQQVDKLRNWEFLEFIYTFAILLPVWLFVTCLYMGSLGQGVIGRNKMAILTNEIYFRDSVV